MLIMPVDAELKEIEKIAESNGRKVITMKAIEEMAELQKALCKLDVAIEKNRCYAEKREILNDLEEEISDVIITLNQCLYIYSIEFENIIKQMAAKTDRQLKRIQEGQ